MPNRAVAGAEPRDWLNLAIARCRGDAPVPSPPGQRWPATGVGNYDGEPGQLCPSHRAAVWVTG